MKNKFGNDMNSKGMNATLEMSILRKSCAIFMTMIGVININSLRCWEWYQDKYIWIRTIIW